MNIDESLLHQAKKLLIAMDKAADDNLPKEISDIVKFHAKGATVAALAAGWIPGAGATAAIIAAAGFIWTMYGRIGAKIELPISNNILKTLAFGVATNLAAYAVGAVALSTAISFIPGLGSIGAAVISGAITYALTLASGYVYLKTMTALFIKGLDPTKLSDEELKNVAKDVSKDSEIKDIIQQAKKDFKSKKKDGEFD